MALLPPFLWKRCCRFREVYKEFQRAQEGLSYQQHLIIKGRLLHPAYISQIQQADYKQSQKIKGRDGEQENK